jgi:hypothetical protein
VKFHGRIRNVCVGGKATALAGKKIKEDYMTTTGMFAKILFSLCLASMLAMALVQTSCAQEVDKGKIPADQLAPSLKKLAWGAPIWDVPEAVTNLNAGGSILWVDTRPESFFKQGTVNGAVLLTYDRKGKEESILNEESLKKAIAAAGFTKDTTTVVFFCQGPECHRSYNATFVAVSEWGYSPEKIVWFRAGYPLLLTDIKNDPKLKRKAKTYLNDAGIRQL